MSRCVKIFLALSLMLAAVCAEEKIYKMCVPQKYYLDCVNLLKEPSQVGTLMECVAGRDRMDCLEKVNAREADVIAVDPEDMYVAYHLNNEDFSVVSEIRTQVEKDAEFRYEGVILVKKDSPIHSLEDLKGKKACYTGFGRNVGYKIPITKLKKAGVLKVSSDPALSPTERELKALSEFFSDGCLVGTYSPNDNVEKLLKKKYSNLCTLCEDPQKCNYPDKYSGYEGAIRCLAEGQGDVAFTKTIFVKKYFGMSGDVAQANKENFQYLCEDGSRKELTDKPCSWAKRPWQGYMTYSDAVKERTQLERLQSRIDSFYNHARESENKEAASNLLIKPDLFLKEKEAPVMPKEYLEHAGYKDVIERDGSMSQKIRFCVVDNYEYQKCEKLRSAAYSRDIRPEFECIQHSKEQCLKAIHDQEADAMILTADDYKMAKDSTLHPVVYEKYAADDLYVVVVPSGFSSDLLAKSHMKYDEGNNRAKYAAYLFNTVRGKQSCSDDSASYDDGQVEIVNAKYLDQYEGKKIVCSDMTLKDVSEYKTCNFEAALPNAVFVRDGLPENDYNNILHAFTLLSERFGPNGWYKDVFAIFDQFLPGHKNVLFHDGIVGLTTEFTPFHGVSSARFEELKCH